MAEFTAVMKAAKRMCDRFEHCSECPMVVTANGCALVAAMGFDKAEKIEQIVMEWANENGRGTDQGVRAAQAE